VNISIGRGASDTSGSIELTFTRPAGSIGPRTLTRTLAIKTIKDTSTSPFNVTGCYGFAEQAQEQTCNILGGSYIAGTCRTITVNKNNNANIAMGYWLNSLTEPLNQLTTGARNIALGSSAGNSITTGSDNIALGIDSLRGDGVNPVVGSQNIGVGSLALRNVSTGSNNLAIGNNAGRSVSSASDNIILGLRALDLNRVTNSSIAIGVDALGSYVGTSTSGVAGYVYNIGIGASSGRGLSDGAENVFMGLSSGGRVVTGSRNISIGRAMAGTGTPSPGAASDNIAIGYQSLDGISEGQHNIALGSLALPTLGSGEHNVAIGYGAGRSTTGNRNVFLGRVAGRRVSTGFDNIAIGREAMGGENISGIPLLGNVTGAYGVAIGTSSLESLLDGSHNTAIGALSGQDVTGGERNTLIGNQAGPVLTNGNENTFIGYNSGPSITIGGSNILIGPNAGGFLSSAASNQLVIGISSGSRLIHGDFANNRVGIGRSPTTNNLEVNGTASKSTVGGWLANSDIRLKNVVGKYKRGLSEILKINPVYFFYKKGTGQNVETQKKFSGIVAQEILPLIPEAVSKNNDGYYQVDNDPIWWAVVNAVKELYKMITGNNDRVQKLEKENRLLKSLVCSQVDSQKNQSVDYRELCLK